jgi:hypothetical protein
VFTEALPRNALSKSGILFFEGKKVKNVLLGKREGRGFSRMRLRCLDKMAGWTQVADG